MSETWEELGDGWYFSDEKIRKYSPSRKYGIDEKAEDALRKSYSKFLITLGKELEVAQFSIAKSIIFCHRFYLRQSHHKNDSYLVAATCMFLACKASETPVPIRDVIRASSDIHNQIVINDELILVAERLVLSTLNFDLDLQTPYTYLPAPIKKFNILPQNSEFPRVAWNFVNDILPTTLCLEFRPEHIAAGAFYLASKFLHFVLPNNVHWWHEFDITPPQLEHVTNRILNQYQKQNMFIDVSGHNRPKLSGNGVSLSPESSPALSSVTVASSNLSPMQQQKYCGAEIDNPEVRSGIVSVQKMQMGAPCDISQGQACLNLTTAAEETVLVSVNAQKSRPMSRGYCMITDKPRAVI